MMVWKIYLASNTAILGIYFKFWQVCSFIQVVFFGPSSRIGISHEKYFLRNHFWRNRLLPTTIECIKGLWTLGIWLPKCLPEQHDETAKQLHASGWLNNPFEKYAQVKLDHFPKDRDENKKCLKPPPSMDICQCIYMIQWYIFKIHLSKMCVSRNLGGNRSRSLSVVQELEDTASFFAPARCSNSTLFGTLMLDTWICMLPSGKLTGLAGKSPFSIGNTSSFRVHVPLLCYLTGV